MRLAGKQCTSKSGIIIRVNVLASSRVSLCFPCTNLYTIAKQEEATPRGVLTQQDTDRVCTATAPKATLVSMAENHQEQAPRKDEKAVSFVPQVRVRRTLSRRDLSSAEAAAIWYTQDEYKRIQKACCRAVIKLEQDEEAGTTRGRREQNKERYCSRGLECHTRRRHSIKAKVRSHSIIAVLEEQDAQWNDEEEDVGSTTCGGGEKPIAFVYRQATAKSKACASSIGLADWHDAKDYYLEGMIDL
jgi:hypothetical protein